ncbi:MAG: glycosyltransferase, partial [Gemmataceae bacterium]
NQAAAIARAPYLLFLNNDTIVPPGTLQQFVRYSQMHPEAGMLGPRLRGGDGEFQISYRRTPTLAALLHRVSLLRWTGLFRHSYYEYRRSTFQPEGCRRVEALMGACVFLPREIFFTAGQWDEQFRFGGEDLELSARVNRLRPVVYVGSVEIIHFGRVASRANAGFVAPNVAVGYVRYFRKAGASRSALLTYKLLVTLDAPVQLVTKWIQGLYRTAIGAPERATKSWESARGLWSFLRHELPRFWAA